MLTCVAASLSTTSNLSITLLMSSLSLRRARMICCCSWASCSLSTPPSEPSPPPRPAPPPPPPPPPWAPRLGLPWGIPPTEHNSHLNHRNNHLIEENNTHSKNSLKWSTVWMQTSHGKRGINNNVQHWINEKAIINYHYIYFYFRMPSIKNL